MKKYSILGLIVGLSVCQFSCRLEQENISTGPRTLHIVTTTGIIEDGVKRIVGDSADVSCIMGPGTDPHLYKPSPGDVEMLDDADVIVCNGLHLEGKMAEMLDKYSQEKPVIKLSDGIPQEQLIKSVDMGDSYDPHIWFDTKIWLMGLEYVTGQLAKLDTSDQRYFESNFANYKSEIEELDEWVLSQLNRIDSTSRILITSHDAFSYFGRRYDIEVKGIQGISTLSEVGLKEISDMVNFIVDKKIAAIFIETSTSQKTAESIKDGCADRKYDLRIEGPLYSDALGEPDSDAATYAGMIRANVTMIVNGLKK